MVTINTRIFLSKKLYFEHNSYIKFSQASITRNTTLDKDFLVSISDIPSSRDSG